MRCWRWIAIAVVLVLLAGGIWLYQALSYVPPYYQAALNIAPHDLYQANREMLRRSTALTNDIKRLGRWQALFTEHQINGWLAVDLPKNHPDLLPAQIHNPRVRITPDGVNMAAQYEGAVSAVASLEIDIGLQAASVLAVRIHKIRIGDVPWAMHRIVDEAVQSARDWGLHVEQTQSDGDPVLLIRLPPDLQEGRHVVLDQLELRGGEVYLSGQTTAIRKP